MIAVSIVIVACVQEKDDDGRVKRPMVATRLSENWSPADIVGYMTTINDTETYFSFRAPINVDPASDEYVAKDRTGSVRTLSIEPDFLQRSSMAFGVTLSA